MSGAVSKSMSKSIAATALSYAGSGVVLPHATNSSTKVLPLSKVRALLLHLRQLVQQIQEQQLLLPMRFRASCLHLRQIRIV
jgi:hypothetical protein